MTEEKLNHKTLKKDEFEKMNIFGMGNPNDAYAKYFVGNSFLNPLTEIESSSVFLANVTFEPGCRNNWHIHHATKGGGQILICTSWRRLVSRGRKRSYSSKTWYDNYYSN